MFLLKTLFPATAADNDFVKYKANIIELGRYMILYHFSMTDRKECDTKNMVE